ncbi:MAG: DUF4037 domain-containing protein, partial [Anaerolineales bacterium]|nr:DUF4037 domain-containing protein [Anaerolineales bacterium]
RLPATFLGYSVHFAPPNEEGTRLMALPAGARVAHRVRVTTVGEFFQDTVGYTSGDAPAPIPPQPAEWLTFSQQHLLSVTAGRVFHDGLGTLAAVRQTLAFYPHDVWLYLLAAQWARIAQEEHLMGRCGYRGDELGSHLIGARLVNDLMRLCFLMARRYAPYPKWFGTAFAALPCAPRMAPLLRQALAAADWRAREAALCQAYTLAAVLHNALGVTPPQETAVSYFHERPFRVSNAGPIIAALRAAIQDPAVRAIPTLIGGIDQFSHSTDLLEDPRLHPPLQALYEEIP